MPDAPGVPNGIAPPPARHSEELTSKALELSVLGVCIDFKPVVEPGSKGQRKPWPPKDQAEAAGLRPERAGRAAPALHPLPGVSVVAGKGTPSERVRGSHAEGVGASQDGAAARGAGRRRARGPRGGPRGTAAQVVPSRWPAGPDRAPPFAPNGQNISNSDLGPDGPRDSIVRLSSLSPVLGLRKGEDKNDTSYITVAKGVK